MSVQNFVPIHLADVEVVAREERLGSGIWFNRDMNVCTNSHRNPFNRCWDSSVWTDYQAGTASLEAKKPQVWWSILTGIIHDPLPRDTRAMFFSGAERWNMWFHKRSVTWGAADITDNWEQLPCLPVEVRSAALPPTTAFMSTDGLKDSFPPVSWVDCEEEQRLFWSLCMYC